MCAGRSHPLSMIRAGGARVPALIIPAREFIGNVAHIDGDVIIAVSNCPLGEKYCNLVNH
jgi:hypothetical protein